MPIFLSGYALHAFIKRKPAGITFKFLRIGFILFFFIFSIVIIRLFVVDIFIVEGISMKNTLSPDNMVLVNKLDYGPKVFNTRLKGIGKVNTGDIVVYRRIKKEPSYIIKRVIAKAGDTLSFDKDNFFVNKQVVKYPKTRKKKYLLKVKNKYRFFRQVDSLLIVGAIENSKDHAGGIYIDLDLFEKLEIEKLNNVNSIEPRIDSTSHQFKHFINYELNEDSALPFIVPKKGMKLTLNQNSYGLYKETIQHHENKSITMLNNKFYIDEEEVTFYTFQFDYCFLLGDNFNNSIDSRHFGFALVHNIVGKVQVTF